MAEIGMTKERLKRALKMTVRSSWSVYATADHLAKILIKQYPELEECDVREIVRLEFWRCKNNNYLSNS